MGQLSVAFPTPVMTAADGQTAQAAVIAALQTRPGPLRTRDIREQINHNRQEPLVSERVYQALVALCQRGLVTRRKFPDHHHVYWQLPKARGARRKPADNEPRRF
jgi:DNA-binding HxlR family transcriptional regulator